MIFPQYCFILLIIPFYIKSLSNSSRIDFPKEDILLKLTDETIDEAMSYFENIFLISTANWCLECNDIIERYINAFKSFSEPVPNTQYAIIDSGYNRKSLYRFGINVYPSVTYIHNKKDYGLYTGILSTKDLKEFMLEKINPPNQEVITKLKIENLRNKYDSVLVYFGNNQSDIMMINDLMFDFNYVKFITFNCGNNEGMKYFYKVKQLRTLVLLKNFDNLRNEMVINDAVTNEQLEKFIRLNGIPIVMKYNDNVDQFIIEQQRTALFLIQSPYYENITTNEIYINNAYNALIYSIAKNYKGQYYFVEVSNNNMTSYKAFLNKEHLSNHEFPSLFFYDKTFKIIASNNESIIIEKLKEFQKIENSKKEVSLLEKSSLMYIDEITFENEVINNDKNVIVFLYSHSSLSSKKIYKMCIELGIKYSNNDKLKFTIIDATINSIIGIVKDHYPMVVLYSSQDKQHKHYLREQASIASIERFIKSHMT